MGQHHRNFNLFAESFENPMELEKLILQILYLSKDEISSRKILRMLPGKHMSKQLVDLLLNSLLQKGLVEIHKVQTSCAVPGTGELIKIQRNHLQNSDVSNTVYVRRDDFGKPNLVSLTHTVYRITEKGIQAVQSNGRCDIL